MRKYVEQGLFGLIPDESEHKLLLHAIRLQLSRNSVKQDGQEKLPEVVEERFRRYMDNEYLVLSQGMGFEWDALIPAINALGYMIEKQHCTPHDARLASTMATELYTIGSEYLTYFFDDVLRQHLSKEVDVSFFDVSVD